MSQNECYWNIISEEWNTTLRIWDEICVENLTNCFWNDVDETWNLTQRIWNQVCPILEEIIVVKHGRIDVQETAREFEKLDKRKKRKLLRVILHLRGLDFEQQREVRDDLSVSVDDIRFLLNEFDMWKRQQEITINVENIRVKEYADSTI